MTDRVGQQLGNYRLIHPLGQGGFAEVYLGEHIHLGTLAAIKILSTKLSAEEIERFREEARTIARLKHLHIVRVLEFGVEGGVPYLVMDFAAGGTLRQRYPKGAQLSPEVIVPYVQQVASALQYAHDRKLIHRDVKPENMLLGESGEVLLSDFGIAIVSQSSRYQPTQDTAGTIAYMAPEQIQAHPRPASDQYSLGIVLYEWLTGERPFTGSMSEILAKQISVPPPPLREKAPELSPALEQVVLTALAKDPKERFASIQAFANALVQATTGSSVDLTLPVPTAPAIRPLTSTPDWNNENQIPSRTLVSQPLSSPPSPSLPLKTLPSKLFQPTIPQLQAVSQPSRRWRNIVLLALIVVILVGASAAAYAAIASRSGSSGSHTTINTPSVTPNPQPPYVAQVPGPADDGCDSGSGLWLARSLTLMQFSCGTTGMKLTEIPNINVIATMGFLGSSSEYRFPTNYTVTVDTNIVSDNACAGLLTHGTGYVGYGFLICYDGLFYVNVYDASTGAPKTLDSGNVYDITSHSLHLQIAVRDFTQVFQVNGAPISTIIDTTYSNTSFIGLVVDAGTSGGSAVFSNFTYTPSP